MREHQPIESTRTKAFERSGVLDTIAAGLSMVIARPYLLLLPLLADVITWLGVQISGKALLDRVGRLMLDQGGENGPDAARVISGLNDNLRINDVGTSLLPSVFGGLSRETAFNLLVHTLAPGITHGVKRGDIFANWAGGPFQTWSPDSWMAVVGIGSLLFFLATVLTVVFRVPIAFAVRGERPSAGQLLRQTTLGWIRVVGLVLIVGVSAGILIVPVAVASGIFLLLGLNLVGVLSLALIIFGGLAAMYTLFIFDAMLVNAVGPIRAIRQSYRVVREHFGSSMRLAFANLLIATGLLQVWQVIMENPPGIVIALVGNALVGTGLSVASMKFFYDRSRWAPSSPAAVKHGEIVHSRNM